MAAIDDVCSTVDVEGEEYLSASTVVDLLLDARNHSNSATERNIVDRNLTSVRGRHLIAACEARRMFDELESVARALPARGIKRLFGQ